MRLCIAILAALIPGFLIAQATGGRAQPVTVTSSNGLTAASVTAGGTPGTNAMAVQGATGGTPIPISGTVTTTPPANASTNVTQFGGTNVSTGTGASGAGIPRVTVSNDSTVGLVAGSAIVGKVGIDQTTPGTTNGVQVNAALPAGANTIGAVTQASGPWTSNITQFGSNNVATGTGASGVGIPRVTVSNDSTVGLNAGSNIVGKVGIDQTTPGTTNGVQVNAALPVGANTIGGVTQSGTWTVQQGTTPGSNAGAWWVRVGDTTNGPAAVKAASTAAAATDPSLVIALSPNSPLPTGSNVVGALVANQSVNVAQVAGNTTTVLAAGEQKIAVEGLAASGAATSGNPVLVGGNDGTNNRVLTVRTGTSNTVVADTALITRQVQGGKATYVVNTGPITGATAISTKHLAYLFHPSGVTLRYVLQTCNVNKAAATGGGTMRIEVQRITAENGTPGCTASNKLALDPADAATGATFCIAPTGAPTTVTGVYYGSDFPFTVAGQVQFPSNLTTEQKLPVMRASVAEGYTIEQIVVTVLASAPTFNITCTWTEE